MPRARSIPQHLEATIMRRWSAGHSAQEIADWIERTNRSRATPVQTSRSSVERVIARYETAGVGVSSLATMQRLRRQAPAQLDVLNQVQAEYERLSAEADTIGSRDEDLAAVRTRYTLKLRTLQRREMLAIRTLRLTGLTGAPGEAFLKANEEFVRETGEELAKEASAELLAERLHDQTADQLAALGTTEEKLIQELERLRDRGEMGEKPPRFNRDSSGGESGSETHGFAEAPPQVPFLKDPSWPLTTDQQAEWRQQKAVINHWLLVALLHGAPNPKPLAELEFPVADTLGLPLGARPVPRAELPDWPLTLDQRAFLEAQARAANGWLAWLRDRLARDFAKIDRAGGGSHSHTSFAHAA